MNRLAFFILFFGLAGCSTGMDLTPYTDPEATPQKFVLCHGYGCSMRTPVGLKDSEWKKIVSVFKHPAKTAEAERAKIAKAVAMMERYTGKKAGTDKDVGEAVTIRENYSQMDCIDETVNTTQYLRFLDTEGALKWHEATLPVHRGYFVDGAWPHNTAAIREKATGRVFVVDAYYLDNGNEPFIIPKEEWVRGWKPPEAE